ncbi:hypothetical protein Q5752_006934 [Cryptotrichosporon argae]
MPACPVCTEIVNADDVAFAHHVNAHFEGGVEGAGGECSSGVVVADEDETHSAVAHCLSCGQSLAHMTGAEKNRHVNDCLDGRAGMPDVDAVWDEDSDPVSAQANGDGAVDAEWNGVARPGSGEDWASKKVAKGDQWWDPVDGHAADVPANYAPGLLPVIREALDASITRGYTRSAVVARDTVHTKSAWGFDIAWGCGYRNALMALSALILAQPAYRPIFSREKNGADPGVRRVQGWIEEAWAAGFDEEGKTQLKGQVLGSRKWIGTTDLYAMFTCLGVPCELYDFPKPKDRKRNAKSGVPTHHVLQQWVRRYFAEGMAQPGSGSAYDVLMRSDDGGSGRGHAVWRSTRFPMILQHMGHSRTIVGYEETARGDINLLLFDPGRSIPKDTRAAGLSSIADASSSRSARATDTSLNAQSNGVASSSHSSERSGRNDADDYMPSPTGEKRTRTAGADDGAVHPRADDAQFVVGNDEEIGRGGWVKKKVRKVVGNSAAGAKDALVPFRVNLSKLSSHAAYQVLVFTGGPVLTLAERAARKHVYSTQVCE